jgi:PKD repeat protein
MTCAQRTGSIIASLAILVALALLAVPVLAGNTVTFTGEIPAGEPPVAAFAGSPTSGTAPLMVTFDAGASAGTITSYAWDFDNNGVTDYTSAAPSASWTYSTAGTYTVKLTVTGSGGSDDEVKPNYITVTAPVKPVAAFSATPTSGYAPLTVQFTDESANNPTSWKWEYKKSGTTTWVQFSTAQHPSFTFTATGTYSIRLTATNAAGSHTKTQLNYISVNAVRKPVALFSQDRIFGRVPLTVTFRDRSLFSPTEYLWTFGDGTTSSEQNPVHTYTRPGFFTVQLRVSNAAGSDTARGIVFVTASRWWW